jgi:hypothetical protein
VSLQGSLSDFPVADVFQLVAQQRKTGVLEVERENRKLEVSFLAGQVLRARPAESRPDGAIGAFALRTGLLSEPDLIEARRAQEETLESLPTTMASLGFVEKDMLDTIQRLMSDEAIFELFLWDDGNFKFRPCGLEQADCDAPVGAEMVLMDALRMRDEWAQIQRTLPDLSVIIAQGVDMEVFREHRAALQKSVSMDPEDLERIYTLCNSRSTARRIIDLSRLGTFEGARGLVAMLREGMLHVSHASTRRETGAAPRLPSQRSMRLPAIAALAVATLVGLVLLLLPGPSAETFPVPAGDLQAARTTAELDRLKLALEAERWLGAGYPPQLDDLRPRWDSLLAQVPLDRYSYARSESGYRLNPD